MWVACHIIIEEGEESKDTVVGCMPCHRWRGRRKRQHGGGLHATLSLKRKKKATTQRVDCMLHRCWRGRRKQRHGVWIARRIVVKAGKESNNMAVGCTLYRRQRGRRKQWHGVWIARRIIVEEGKESNDTAVGCMPHRRRRGRRKQWHGSGLHTVSSSKGEKKATTRRWCTPRRRLPCLLLPSYPPSSLSFNPPNWLSLSSMWLLG